MSRQRSELIHIVESDRDSVEGLTLLGETAFEARQEGVGDIWLEVGRVRG